VADYTPTPEAVEAAARAIHANDFERGLVAEDVWGDLTDETREWYVANATSALTAAGPIIAAEALREAADWLADMDDGRDTAQHRAGRDIIARIRDRAVLARGEGT